MGDTQADQTDLPLSEYPCKIKKNKILIRSERRFDQLKMRSVVRTIEIGDVVGIVRQQSKRYMHVYTRMIKQIAHAHTHAHTNIHTHIYTHTKPMSSWR